MFYNTYVKTYSEYSFNGLKQIFFFLPNYPFKKVTFTISKWHNFVYQNKINTVIYKSVTNSHCGFTDSTNTVLLFNTAVYIFNNSNPTSDLAEVNSDID